MTADSNRARAQSRFARSAFTIYGGSAAIAVLLLGAAFYTDRVNQDQIATRTLELSNVVRADYLARYLAMLAGELRRLSLRAEIDLLDASIEPERSLLRLSHDKSTFFNVGVSIIDPSGTVAWSEPETFLPPGRSLGGEPWFQSVRDTRSMRIVPVTPEQEKDAIVYVVSPIVREGRFAGALLGAIDLAFSDQVEPTPTTHVTTPGTKPVLALLDGRVVYPPNPPSYSLDPMWRALFHGPHAEPFVTNLVLGGERTIVAGAPVHGTDLVLLRVAPERAIFGPSQQRFWERMSAGFILAVAPLLLLALQLRRALTTFSRSEDAALREDRLISVGEAANLIAHEVKNALNGLRMGIDMLLAGERREGSSAKSAAAEGLRREIQHLSEFTTELLIFSKGVSPRPTKLELVELTERIAELHAAPARDAGVELVLDAPGRRVVLTSSEEGPAIEPANELRVTADPQLVHVVITNLVGNAIEALSSVDVEHPRVIVALAREGDRAVLTVTDDGPGVPDALKPRLFEPFVTGKPSGTGLGLALSRKIARAHGGDLVLADSTPGAKFVLTLPMETT